MVAGKLVFCWFFGTKLGNGLSRDRIRDGKRYRKIGKDTKKIAKSELIYI